MKPGIHLDITPEQYFAGFTPTPALSNEEWRPIEGFSAYEVSSFGRIKRIVHTVRRTGAGDILVGSVNQRGYRAVVLWEGPIRKNCEVHRIVCVAFHGPPPNPGKKSHASHRDGNRLNNHFSNLRWATPAENSTDRFSHGTMFEGERSKWAKLKDHEVMAIRADGRTNVAIADDYDIHPSHVWNIKQRRSWRHIP